ncbi:MAG: 2-oxo-4-hydroxy-4-carboxy-5-ureidoimidazoline decarboxylase [Verrucomicrobiia bacterium]
MISSKFLAECLNIRHGSRKKDGNFDLFPVVLELHQKLCKIVAQSSEQKQLALLNAHPDLVGKIALEGKLTQASTQEQASAGLTQLSTEEIQLFQTNNRAYREKFGFPFYYLRTAQ